MELLPSGRYFDDAVVITLPKRKARVQHFYRLYHERIATDTSALPPFPKPRVFTGVDALRLGKPRWFPRSPGTWGCRASHLRAIEEAALRGTRRLLVFEDDACLEDGREGLFERMTAFLEAVPDDWDFLQLGYGLRGEKSERKGAFRYADWVVDTHAIAFRGSSLPRIYRELQALRPGHAPAWIWPIDQHLCWLANTDLLRRYLPRSSLIHQNKEFPSDIQGR